MRAQMMPTTGGADASALAVLTKCGAATVAALRADLSMFASFTHPCTGRFATVTVTWRCRKGLRCAHRQRRCCADSHSVEGRTKPLHDALPVTIQSEHETQSWRAATTYDQDKQITTSTDVFLGWFTAAYALPMGALRSEVRARALGVFFVTTTTALTPSRSGHAGTKGVCASSNRHGK